MGNLFLPKRFLTEHRALSSTDLSSLLRPYTESGLKLLGLDLASLATQGVCAGAQPNAYTGYGIYPSRTRDKGALLGEYAKGNK